MERTAAGELRIPESADNVGLVGTASGSLIGMLVGVLLGWGAGALMGGAFDVDRAVTSDEALTVLGRAIPPGSTAVIASVEEPARRYRRARGKAEGEAPRVLTAARLRLVEARQPARPAGFVVSTVGAAGRGGRAGGWRTEAVE